jgi:hypothetical protein
LRYNAPRNATDGPCLTNNELIAYFAEDEYGRLGGHQRYLALIFFMKPYKFLSKHIFFLIDRSKKKNGRMDYWLVSIDTIYCFVQV